MLPRYGFMNEVRPSAHMGPGYGQKVVSPRIDPNPPDNRAYEMPPLHVYKERSHWFRMAPKLPPPPKFVPPPYQPPPEWAKRLSIMPPAMAEKAAELSLKRSASGGLGRSQSHSILATGMLTGHAGNERKLRGTESVPMLLQSMVHSSGGEQAAEQAAVPAHEGPPAFKLIIEVEHCTAHRPTAVLKGSAENYVEAAQRLDAAISELAPTLGCEYELRVNPLLELVRAPSWMESAPTTKRMVERQMSGQLQNMVPTSPHRHRAAPERPATTTGYPRIGAFEVSYALRALDSGIQIAGGPLYSKLATLKWPNTGLLVRAMTKVVAHAKAPPAPPARPPKPATPPPPATRKPPPPPSPEPPAPLVSKPSFRQESVAATC